MAPINAFILADIIDEVGLPKGVFNMVTGLGPVVGEAIVSHPKTDMVSFTGSTRAGKRVMQLASEMVKSVSLELGGKSANIILEDADFPTAVARRRLPALPQLRSDLLGTDADGRATFATQPKSRTSLSRRGRAWRRPTRSRVRACSARSSARCSSNAYATTSTRASTKARGSSAVASTPPEGLEQGYYVPPTIFSDVRNDMTIAQEEIFGPVLSIIPYDTEEEAIAIANDSAYGLAGGVWAGTEEKAFEVARKLRTGQVYDQRWRLQSVAPFGGYKQSGIGRERGEYGFEEFLEVKAIQHN